MLELSTIYKCPICSSILNKSTKVLSCENNHSFDISKEGYVNLILANQKKSLKSGDSKEMINFRNLFLSTGNYDFLLDKIIEQIDLKRLKNKNFLDIGCGSGYYIDKLEKKFKNASFYGVDVSKSSIVYSSKNYPNINFSVGNSYNLPFIDNIIDCAFSIFAPFNENEITRIMRKKGLFIVVRPGPNHLLEIYERFAIPHKEKREIVFKDLDLLETINISKVDTVNEELITSLIGMTPLFWKIPLEKQKNQKFPTITYDFIIYIYKKTK